MGETAKVKQGEFMQYYDKQLAAFRRHMRNALKNGTMENIHKLRVSIKKLRTLWSLIEVASDGKWKSRPCLELFEDLFQVAGQLRETQVNLRLLEPWQAACLESFTGYLQKTRKRAGKKLHKGIHGFDRKKFGALNKQLRRKMRALSDEAVFEASVALAVKGTKKVLALAGQLPDSGKLHKIRIRQKAVQEILAVLKHMNADLAMEAIQNPIRSQNARIGNWHDTVVLLDALKRFEEKGADKTSRRQLKALGDRVQEHMGVQLGEVYELLHKDAIAQQLVQLENLTGMQSVR